MVLPRSVDASTSGSRIFIFDCSLQDDIVKKIFYYENVITKRKSWEEKTSDLIWYVDDEAFDVYYESYAIDGALSEQALDYFEVKRLLLGSLQSLNDSKNT